jgi:hypothetical protein
MVQKKKQKQFKPKFIKSMTFNEVMEDVKKKHEQNLRLYQENNGICINCKKNSGDKLSFICSECQAKIDKIVAELRGQGFVEMTIPIKRQLNE